jgi:hypothetical protein
MTLHGLSLTFGEQEPRRSRPRDFPSHEIRLQSPSSEILNLSPLRNPTNNVSQPGASQAPDHVPISRFLTASPVYSSNSTAGLLRPASKRGVHFVFRVLTPFYVETFNGSQVAGLKMLGFTPDYEFPDSAALCVSAVFAFLTFALKQQPTVSSVTHRNALPIIRFPVPFPKPENLCADSHNHPKVTACLSGGVSPGQ